MKKQDVNKQRKTIITFTQQRRKDVPKLLTVDEVAALLQVPVSWVYGRTRDNTIPTVRVGKYVRFNKSEILAWVNARCPSHWPLTKKMKTEVKAHHPSLVLSKR